MQSGLFKNLKMRNIIFKNLTSSDRRKKIIVSDESFDKSGIHTHIQRHLICLVRKIYSEKEITQPLPHLYVLKETNTQKQTKKFILKLKGSIYTIVGNSLFLITFLHSLKIEMSILNTQPLDTSI